MPRILALNCRFCGERLNDRRKCPKGCLDDPEKFYEQTLVCANCGKDTDENGCCFRGCEEDLLCFPAPTGKSVSIKA